jgi:ornithine carbamoyltransferase
LAASGLNAWEKTAIAFFIPGELLRNPVSLRNRVSLANTFIQLRAAIHSTNSAQKQIFLIIFKKNSRRSRPALATALLALAGCVRTAEAQRAQRRGDS